MIYSFIARIVEELIAFHSDSE